MHCYPDKTACTLRYALEAGCAKWLNEKWDSDDVAVEEDLCRRAANCFVGNGASRVGRNRILAWNYRPDVASKIAVAGQLRRHADQYDLPGKPRQAIGKLLGEVSIDDSAKRLSHLADEPLLQGSHAWLQAHRGFFGAREM
jgi:hypothetical protein